MNTNREELAHSFTEWDAEASDPVLNIQPYAGPIADVLLELNERLQDMETIFTDQQAHIAALKGRLAIMEDETEPADTPTTPVATTGLQLGDVLALIKALRDE